MEKPITKGLFGFRGSYASLQQIQKSSQQLPIQISPSKKSLKMINERSLFNIGMVLLCCFSLALFGSVLYFCTGPVSFEKGHPNGNYGFQPSNGPTIMEKNINVNLSRNYFDGYTLPPGNPCESFKIPPPPADKKRTGPRPCPVCYLPLDDAIDRMPNAPSFSPVLQNLTYIHEENLSKSEFGGSEFGGYPSLSQRTDSYDIRESMNIHCGFVRGMKPGPETAFDIDESDRLKMQTCERVVASANFGNFDVIRQPTNTSEYSKENFCFHMFVDEETEASMRDSNMISEKHFGIWRVIVVRNLPYEDHRRNGKIPKLLLHRLFPNAKYSIWMDAKLQLQVDPVLILERFLWRQNASFAISRHYKRFDVFDEAEANKAAKKYDNASIDFQIEFYKMEGLTPYSAKKLPITSDVPEGCVIVREHIPISNLFTCLWFNEVDRFTSRDQLGFSTVRDKIRSKTNYTINMFLDCERRNFVDQQYHRDLLEQVLHPPSTDSKNINSTSGDGKIGDDRRTRGHRKINAGSLRRH